MYVGKLLSLRFESASNSHVPFNFIQDIYFSLYKKYIFYFMFIFFKMTLLYFNVLV